MISIFPTVHSGPFPTDQPTQPSPDFGSSPDRDHTIPKTDRNRSKLEAAEKLAASTSAA